MKYSDISCYGKINETNPERVKELAESMIANGWQGCPILVCGESLLTGSHRLDALHMVAEDNWDAEVLEQDVAEDVSDIVNEKIAEFEEENGYTPDIDYSNIGWLLKGSWVERYKDEIVEW